MIGSPPSSAPNIAPRYGLWSWVIVWWRFAFGAHLLFSGIAFAATGWVPMDMTLAHSGTGQFLIALNKTGLYACVKYFEIVIGTLLVTNRAVPLALVIHMPITMMIGYLNLVVQPHGRELFTGPQELAFHIPLLVAYGGYYAPFLRWRSEPWLLFSNLPAHSTLPAPLKAGGTSDASTRILPACLVLTGMALLILAGSRFLPPPERQLVPRDWFPILCGSLGLLLVWFRHGRPR